MAANPQSSSDNTPVIGHFIKGRISRGESGKTENVFNPATGEVSGAVCVASSADVEKVVSVAREAARSWGTESLSRRSKILFNFRQLLADEASRMAEVITAEHGKVLSDAEGEIARGLETAEYACGLIEHMKGEYSSQVSSGVDVYSVREPIGVVAGITPFNFPAMVPLWMFPIALATGNTFILKPSPRDPSVTLIMANLLQQAGLPDGVFNVLQGDQVAVEGLIAHPEVDAISFVGSTPVARKIRDSAIAHDKRVQALGGAKNHAVILPDADPDYAADQLSSAAFGSAGQRCMAISVAVAVADSADRLVDRVTRLADDITVTEGVNPQADMGPLISAASKQRVERIIGEAQADGATLSRDGRNLVVPGHEDGFFVGPTVLDKVTGDMSAYREEIFGPVLSVVRVDDVDSAIKFINANPYGNGTSIITNSGADARKFQRGVKVGMVGINVPIPVPISNYSFGGWNDSLFGDLHIYGEDGVRFYTRQKVITQRWPEPAHRSRASFDFPAD